MNINTENKQKKSQFDESCYFIDTDGVEYIYACKYFPSSGYYKTGFIIAPPVGRERLNSCLLLANLSRSLAARGFPVIRFDYRGEGESYGRFENYDISSRVKDIEYVIHEFNNILKLDEICLVGFRLGAVISILAAVDQGIQKLVLCEPFFDTRSYAKSILKSNIILQKYYFGEVTANESKLTENIINGISVNHYGFSTSTSFYKQLMDNNLLFKMKQFTGRSAIINFVLKQPAESNSNEKNWCELLNQNGEASIIYCIQKHSWSTRNFWIPKWDSVDSTIMDWLLTIPEDINKS